ncbi:MAG: DUF305 domain-containing protein [Ilumatobacteraceae bacterium]
MRSPTRADDMDAPVVAESDVEQSVSDETTERLLKGVLITISAVIVLGLFAGAAIWALQGDEEPPVPMNAVDVGFLQDMLDHHEQALLISNLYLDNQPDGPASPYANEVIMFQTRDMGWMRDWLAEEGYEPGAPDRTAMEWMGEPVPVAEMPGMQTPERLQQLADANGTEADLLWFELMTDHHLGGVHMGDHAAANGAREEIVEFAESVSRNQRIEVVEYEGAMRRLGLTP